MSLSLLVVSIYHRYYRIGEHGSRAHHDGSGDHSQQLVDSSTSHRRHYNNMKAGSRLNAVAERHIVASIAVGAAAAVDTTYVRVSVFDGLNFFLLLLFFFQKFNSVVQDRPGGQRRRHV